MPLLCCISVSGNDLTSESLCLVKFLFMNQFNVVIALRSIVSLVDAGHLVSSAAVVGRKTIDHQVSMLIAPGLEVDDSLSGLYSCVHSRKVPGWPSAATH